MTLPSIIFGLGATKAGTSWLWEYLAAHPDVSARGVKELHYFDTFAPEDQQRQLAGFANARRRMKDAGRVADMDALCDVLAGDRSGDAGYSRYVSGQGVALDVTPSYAQLPVNRLRQMAAMFANARFVYLVRDPVERLWSHIRMEVARRMQPGADFDNRARGMLRRITDEDGEPQIAMRGEYADAIGRMTQAIPADQLAVLVSEEMTQQRVCAAVGLRVHDAATKSAHVGTTSDMQDGMRNRAARFLRQQYQLMAEVLGRIPAAWQANYERAIA